MKMGHILSLLAPETAVITETAEVLETAGEVALESAEAAQLSATYSAFDLKRPLEAWMQSGVHELSRQLEMENARATLKEAEGWIREINPLYRPNEHDSPNMYNWGSSAIAVERRLMAADAAKSGIFIQGANPEAKAVLDQTNLRKDMKTALNRNVYEGSQDMIFEELHKRGPGAHMVAGVKCKGKPDFWFNVFYDGQDVYHIDAHKGEWSYIKKGLPKFKIKKVQNWLLLA